MTTSEFPAWSPVEVTEGLGVPTVKDMKIAGTLALPEGAAERLLPIGANRLLMLDDYGRPVCIDTLTGQTLWEQQEKRGRCNYVDGILYGSYKERYFAATDPATGQNLWTAYLGTGEFVFCTDFLFHENRIAVSHGRKSVTAIDLVTRKIKWSVWLGGDLRYSPGVIWRGSYVVQTGLGKCAFHVIDIETGEVVRKLTPKRGHSGAGYTGVCVSGDRMWYLGDRKLTSVGQDVMCLDLETGEERTMTPAIGGVSYPAGRVHCERLLAHNGKLYLWIDNANWEDTLQGIYECDLDLNATRLAECDLRFGGMLLFGDNIVFSRRPYVGLLDTAARTFRQLELPGESMSEPVFNNGTIFVAQDSDAGDATRRLIAIR